MSAKQKNAFADKKMFGRAVKDSFIKLSPKTQTQNPVMFLVFVSAILTSVLWIVSLFGLKDAPSGYTLAIAIILWFTVLFANFAEAIAEGRGKAQADSLRASRKDVDAHKIPSAGQKDKITVVPSAMLKKVIWSLLRLANRFRQMEKSLRVRPPWMKAPSPENPLLLFGKRAATAAP